MDKSFYDADEIKRKCEQMYKDVESQVMYIEEHLKRYDTLIGKLNMQAGLSAELRGMIRLNPRGSTSSDQQAYIHPFPGETAGESRDWLIANKIKLQKYIFDKEGEKEEGNEIDGTEDNKQDELRISKDQFVFIIKTLGNIDVVSPVTVDNVSAIYDGHFVDDKKPCSKIKKYRIDFITTWFNVRYIFEELFKGWFKEKMSWKYFVEKHMFLNGKRVHSYNKNTKDYKDMVDETVKGNVEYIRAYVIKNSV